MYFLPFTEIMSKCVLIIFVLCSVAAGPVRSADCEDKKCSHNCVNLAGTPSCSCPEDMTLGPDSSSCQAQVLLAMNRGINLLTLGKMRSDMKTIIPHRVTAFDISHAKGEIFAFKNNSIQRYLLEVGTTTASAGVRVLATETMVTSIAVDWVHDVLYWISHQGTVVESATTQGGNHKVLVQSNTTVWAWHNIVVDPYVKRLFWLGNNEVHTCDLAGGNHHKIPVALQAEDIALDTRRHLFYVIGTKDDKKGVKAVVRCGYDESQLQELLEIPQPESKIYGFGVVGKVLYWQTSYDGENLYRAELPPTAEVKTKVTLAHEVMDVVYDMKLFHPDIQKPKI